VGEEQELIELSISYKKVSAVLSKHHAVAQSRVQKQAMDFEGTLKLLANTHKRRTQPRRLARSAVLLGNRAE